VNWKQIHTTATPQERGEIAMLLLARIEAHNGRVLVLPHRLVRERRRFPARYHLVNERRGRHLPHPLPVPVRFGVIHTVITMLMLVITPPPSIVPPYMIVFTWSAALCTTIFLLSMTRMFSRRIA
jgi:hypothetical protein